MKSFKLSTVLINLDSERLSGSENGLGPAYVIEHGLFEAPNSANLEHVSRFIKNQFDFA